MVAGAVMSFGLVVLVSRWLQPREAGSFFELIALFTILANTFELGADTGLTRWISRARAIGGLADVRRILAIAVIPVVLVGTAAEVLLWLNAPLIAGYFLHGISPAAGVADIRIIAPLVPVGAVSACIVDGARGFGLMWPYLAIEGVGKPATRIAAVVGVLVAGLGLHAAVIAWGAPVVAGLVFGCFVIVWVLEKEAPVASRHTGRRASKARQVPTVEAGADPPASGHRGHIGHWPLVSIDQPAQPERWDRWQFRAIPELDATVELPVVFDPVAPRSGPASSAGTSLEASGDGGRHRRPLESATIRTWQLAREFWGFTGPRAFQATFQVVILWLDILIVGALTSSYQAGIYSAVSKLAIIGTFALEGNRLAIGPQLSVMLARQQNDRAADLYQTSTRWLVLASWPLYLVLMIFPAVVLGIFGPRYTAGASALVVLSIAMLVNLGTGNVTVVLLMGGKSTWSAVNAGAALAVNIGLNLLLVPRIGILGAAVAWAASIMVDNVAAMLEIKWVLGLAPLGGGYWLAALVTVGCFGVTGVAARLMLGETLLALCTAVGLGLAAFGTVLYFARDSLQITGLFAALRYRTPSMRRAELSSE